MPNCVAVALFSATLAAMLTSPCAAQLATFRPIEGFGTGTLNAWGLSADGRIALVYVDHSGGTRTVGLYHVDTNTFETVHAGASQFGDRTLSADGSAVITATGVNQPRLWRRGQPAVALPPNTWGFLNDNGSAAVGIGAPHPGLSRWAASDGVVPLVASDEGSLRAQQCWFDSNGGLTISGYQWSSFTTQKRNFVWRSGTDIQYLPAPAYDPSNNPLVRVTAEGSSAVCSVADLAPLGELTNGRVYIQDLTTHAIELIPAIHTRGLFGGLPNRDATVIFAHGANATGGYEACIWDRAHGTRRLADVLTAQGADLQGMTLTATGQISADGRTILGSCHLNNAYRPFIATITYCGTADFDGDGDSGTDADIEAFFACLAGSCCAQCFTGGADFNVDGDSATDADIEAFFRVLAGGAC